MELTGFGENPPVLVADEPDPAKPDEWLIHAYFDHEPTADDLAALRGLAASEPKVEQLGDANWVAMSQAGLQPIRAGRFTVHTPTFRPDPGRVNFEIDAGLAFGTGQHATTAGCLAALDNLEDAAKRHDVRLILLKVEHKWDDLRGEPRFNALMRRIGFE